MRCSIQRRTNLMGFWAEASRILRMADYAPLIRPTCFLPAANLSERLLHLRRLALRFKSLGGEFVTRPAQLTCKAESDPPEFKHFLFQLFHITDFVSEA